jgi:hypothetical protein
MLINETKNMAIKADPKISARASPRGYWVSSASIWVTEPFSTIFSSAHEMFSKPDPDGDSQTSDDVAMIEYPVYRKARNMPWMAGQ